MAMQEELERQGNWLFRYRGILPIIILFVSTAVYLHTELYPESFFLEETPYEIYYEMGCLFISLLGLFIRVYTVGHTPANTSGRNTAEGQVAARLNTTGIYSVVRHPLYLGNFLMWLGIAMLTGSLWFIVVFCIIYIVYYERIMYAEEQFLRRKFGTEYTRWAERTPAFIPRFRLFVRSSLPFSWKKVLKKEKNGLLALFLVFGGYDVAGELVERENHYNSVLIGACIVCVITYCVLKYMKYKTRILDEPER